MILYMKDTNLESLYHRMDIELVNLSSWTKANFFSFIVKKTIFPLLVKKRVYNIPT